jgi:hypothetical protein
MANNDMAYNRLYRAVRKLPWKPPLGEAIRYYVKPDERFDPHAGFPARLWHARGIPCHSAAAGLDSAEYPLEAQTLVLPTAAKLRELRREAGFDGYEII